MAVARNSLEQAQALGASLRARRKACYLTLQNVEKETAVNVGQLSRFERGEFKLASENLQKYTAFLQIFEQERTHQPDLVGRFAQVITRSSRHEAAAKALLSALERLL